MRPCVCGWGGGLRGDERPPADLLFLSACPTQEKCYQYWPDQGCWTYGNIRVCVEDCAVLVDYTIRKFCIQSVSTRLPTEAGLRGETRACLRGETRACLQ